MLHRLLALSNHLSSFFEEPSLLRESITVVGPTMARGELCAPTSSTRPTPRSPNAPPLVGSPAYSNTPGLVAVPVMTVFNQVSSAALVTFLPGLSVARPDATFSSILFLPGLDTDVGIGPGVLTDDEWSWEDELPFLIGDSRSSGSDGDASTDVILSYVLYVTLCRVIVSLVPGSREGVS